jgi:HAD superfamily phosphatase (TIGR01668 family)
MSANSGPAAPSGHKRLLSPDCYYTSVHAIDLDELRASGVRGLLLDLDNTLLPRDTNVVPDELVAWAARVREHGFKACLVSNNWHGRVHAVAVTLGFELVDKAIKPLPFAFRRALERTCTPASETAVIGDQLFTDILGGNLMGMRTLMVEPLSRTDLPHTLILRRMEARLMRGRLPDA